MGFFRGAASVLGRGMLCAIFAMSAIGNKLPHFEETVTSMQAEGVPQPRALLTGAIVFLILGSLFVIVGYASRLGALLLLIFLVLATYYFHDFWHFPDGPERIGQTIQFMKNVAIAGALLGIIVNGPGAGALGRPADPPESDYDFR